MIGLSGCTSTYEGEGLGRAFSRSSTISDRARGEKVRSKYKSLSRDSTHSTRDCAKLGENDRYFDL